MKTTSGNDKNFRVALNLSCMLEYFLEMKIIESETTMRAISVYSVFPYGLNAYVSLWLKCQCLWVLVTWHADNHNIPN